MNRYASVPILFLVLLAAGCVDVGPQLSIFGLEIGPGEPVYTTHENLILETQTIPEDVYEGRSTTIFFDVHNRGNVTINIELEMTDIGEFSTPQISKSIDELEEGEMETWNWKLDSNHDVHDELKQELRYELSYESESSALYDLIAMSEDEYVRLEREGRLGETELFYYKTNSPVDIDLSLSKEQPFFGGLEFYLYLSFTDLGGGAVDSLSGDDVTVHYPSFLEFVESSDFQSSDGVLTLSRPLEFYNKKTKKTSAKFRVSGIKVSEIEQFRVEANYIYTYHKTINIKIKPM